MMYLKYIENIHNEVFWKGTVYTIAEFSVTLNCHVMSCTSWKWVSLTENTIIAVAYICNKK